MSREIQLTQGKVAIVDDADYALVSQFKWYAIKGRRENWYAKRRPRPDEDRTQNFSLHQFLLGFPDGEIDHKNRDGLDNRRTNLRTATRSLNQINSGPTSRNRFGLKGVSQNVRGRPYAQIGHGKKKIFIGRFDTVEEAARAYDAKAKELYGDFAYLNFPDEVAR